jgi:regulator of sirC expression with transglutaminase-like and TPR domain
LGEYGLLGGSPQTMSVFVTIETPTTLSQGQRKALISLLADDDISVYHTIRRTLLSYGHEAVGWLRPHLITADPVLRRRVQEAIQHLERQEADNHFLSFCLKQSEGLDVEMGSWLLAQTHYPDINFAAYQALLDSFADSLRERLLHTNNASVILETINRYLFNELGFSGNEENYYEPDNSYLNRVIDRRTGNPISLCLIYLLITRRLRLPVVGIGMPGHFLCRYQSPVSETYVDAFNRGKMLTKAECIKYLMQSGHGYLDGYLAPVSPRRMLLRACTNLHQIYVDLELPKEAARLQRYILALSK